MPVLQTTRQGAVSHGQQMLSVDSYTDVPVRQNL